MTQSASATPEHTFHIPVMGIGFTLDTPLRVARFGLSSCMSLVDDTLIDQVRCHYAAQLGTDPAAIARTEPDSRARRITAYLDLIDSETQRQVRELRASSFDAADGIRRYFELLPQSSAGKQLYDEYCVLSPSTARDAIEAELRRRVCRGPIEVNIMTKLDRGVDERGEPRPEFHSDALAALRGFALSTLDGNVVLSAGVNQKVATYVASFGDFHPDNQGNFKKRVVLKVSDFRSARIQSKLCIKRGVWVSEFRVESGLNCGGHAFATEGVLLGPILEEFQRERAELHRDSFEGYRKALAKLSLPAPEQAPSTRVTVQGGIGTAAEDRFLVDYYQVDGTGWGTPFLLVPEVSSVDADTRKKLAEATSAEVRLGHGSPLGVHFWNLTTTASDEQRRQRVNTQKPGSPCPKGHCALSFDYGKVPLCAASRLYQKRKLRELPMDLDEPTRQKVQERITSPLCICHDLGASIKLIHGIETDAQPCICPGPNIAYFSSEMTLEQLVGHIYGKSSLALVAGRPHLLLNELSIYLDYFDEQLAEVGTPLASRPVASLERFVKNLEGGVAYYWGLGATSMNPFSQQDGAWLRALSERLEALKVRCLALQSAAPPKQRSGALPASAPSLVP